MKLRYQQYRVYPNVGHARSFVFLLAAQDFAQISFVRQGIADTRPVSVVNGSGSDFRIIGTWGVWGWRGRDGATAEPVVGGEDSGAGAQRQSAKTGVRY